MIRLPSEFERLVAKELTLATVIIRPECLKIIQRIVPTVQTVLIVDEKAPLDVAAHLPRLGDYILVVIVLLLLVDARLSTHVFIFLETVTENPDREP